MGKASIKPFLAVLFVAVVVLLCRSGLAETKNDNLSCAGAGAVEDGEPSCVVVDDDDDDSVMGFFSRSGPSLLLPPQLPAVLYWHNAAQEIKSFVSLQEWGLDRYSDFDMDVAMKKMDDNTAALVNVVLAYLAMVFLLPKFSLKLQGKGSRLFSFKMIKNARQLWNIVLAAFSMIGTVHVFFNLLFRAFTLGLTESVCADIDTYTSGPVGFWMTAFLISKILEFGDTLLLILSHGKRPSFLHWFHHGTVLPLTWRAFVLRSSFGQWFVAINYAVHSIMYTYFALNDTFDDVRFRQDWGKRITFTQCAQFVLDLGIVGIAARQHLMLQQPCSVTTESIAEFGLILSLYLGLFLQFAEEKYGFYSRFKHTVRRWMIRRIGTRSQQDQALAAAMPWQRTDLPLSRRFDEATKVAPLFLHVASKRDLGALYGNYKQAHCGKPPDGLPPPAEDDDKAQLKRRAWTAVQNKTKEQAQQTYLDTLDKLYQRAEEVDHRSEPTTDAAQCAPPLSKTSTTQDPFVLYPVRIAGVGSYLPRRVVCNDEIERLGGFPPGSVDKSRAGVKQRHWADLDGGESIIQNAARAIRGACADAGVNLADVDLLVGCHGGHQGIPDDACLVQRELGLGESGIRSFTVHSTCLSFLVAMDVASSFMNDGRYLCAVVFASYVTGYGLNHEDPHTAALIGDGAAAVVLQPSSSDSAIHRVYMETFAEGADLCRIRGIGHNRPGNKCKPWYLRTFLHS